jgi:hypothetical protein
MNTPQNAESAALQNSAETTPEIRVASSTQTSDPPPTAEEPQPDQKNTAMNTPQNVESPAAAQSPEITPNLGVAPPPPNGPAPATPREQEQENGKGNTAQNAESGAAAATPPAASKPQQGQGNQALVLSPVLGKVEFLTEIEQATLWACEEVIGSGWHTFVQVGLALAQIRDDRLYKVDFDTFERYCQVKWQYGRNYVNRLISAAQVFTHLVTISHQKPEHETQVRPLVGLTAEQAQKAEALHGQIYSLFAKPWAPAATLPIASAPS